MWLRAKMGAWDVDQFVHEVTGPSAKSWARILGTGCTADRSGVLFLDVAALFARPDIASHARVSDLLSPLKFETLETLATQVCMGALSRTSARTAAQTAGPSWSELVTSASNVLTLLHAALRTSSIAGLFAAPLELLTDRVEALASPAAAPGASSAVTAAVAALTAKLELVERVVSMLRAGEDRRISDERARLEKVSAGLVTVRRGARVVFLDDPGHDHDFVGLPIMPTAEELLTPSDSALPRNLVVESSLPQLRRTLEFARGGGGAVDDDAAVDDADRTAAIASYRSVRVCVGGAVIFETACVRAPHPPFSPSWRTTSTHTFC